MVPDGDVGAGEVRSRRGVALLTAVGAAVVAADVATKLLAVEHLAGRAPIVLVPRVLDLQLTRNSGAAFSLAGGATVALSVVAFAVVVVIARTARRLRSAGWALVLGLLVGGALGNLIDRVIRSPGPLRGHVVDWIHLANWPVFNVADAAITVGGVLAVGLSLRGVGLDGRRAPDGRHDLESPGRDGREATADVDAGAGRDGGA
jgi:signal peptidase II